MWGHGAFPAAQGRSRAVQATTLPQMQKRPQSLVTLAFLRVTASGWDLLTVGDTGIEPVTSSVSGKRAPAALIARADDGTRTRDPHLGKVMLYQLSHIRAPHLMGAG